MLCRRATCILTIGPVPREASLSIVDVCRCLTNSRKIFMTFNSFDDLFAVYIAEPGDLVVDLVRISTLLPSFSAAARSSRQHPQPPRAYSLALEPSTYYRYQIRIQIPTSPKKTFPDPAQPFPEKFPLSPQDFPAHSYVSKCVKLFYTFEMVTVENNQNLLLNNNSRDQSGRTLSSN